MLAAPCWNANPSASRDDRSSILRDIRRAFHLEGQSDARVRRHDDAREIPGRIGAPRAIEWISEAQVFLRRNVFLKLNSAFGLTSKAPDWAPEVGIMFVF